MSVTCEVWHLPRKNVGTKIPIQVCNRKEHLGVGGVSDARPMNARLKVDDMSIWYIASTQFGVRIW